MELDSFESANFDVKKWVNDTISHMDTNDQETSLDAQVTTIVMKLQLLSQDISNSLQDNAQLMLNSLPKTLRDIERVQRDSITLKECLSTLTSNVEQLETNSLPVDANIYSGSGGEIEGENKGEEIMNSPSETLESLHKMNDNLTQCIKMLQEAANWERLVQETEAQFIAQNLDGVARRLGDLEQSKRLLSGMPEAQQRARKLEQMEEKLEELIVPGLRRALEESNNHEQGDSSDEDLVRFISVFRQLERMEMIEDEYSKTKTAYAITEWNSLREISQNVDFRFRTFLSRFYDRLFSVIEKEQKRCLELFGDQYAMEVLARVIKETLSLKAFLSKFKDELSVLPLEEIVMVNGLSLEFAERVLDLVHLSLMNPHKVPNQNEEYKDSIHVTSLENEEIGGKGQNLDFKKEWKGAITVADTIVNSCVFVFFEDYYSTYGSLEREWINFKVQEAIERNKGSVVDSPSDVGVAYSISQILNQTLEHELIVISEGALLRCIQFTGAAGIDSLLNALSKSWSQHIDRIQDMIRELLGNVSNKFLFETSQINSVEASASDYMDFDSIELNTPLMLLQSVTGLRINLSSFASETIVEKILPDVEAFIAASEESKLKTDVLGDGDKEIERTSCKLKVSLKFGDMRVLNSFLMSPSQYLQERVAEPLNRCDQLVEQSTLVVYNVMMKPINKSLSQIPNLTIWDQGDPGFGTPSKYMQDVSQHIWTLPEQLESYALAAASKIYVCIPDLDILGEADRNVLENALGITYNSRHTLIQLAEDDICTEERDGALENGGNEKKISTAEEESSNRFVRWWLAAITNGSVIRFLLRVIQIPKLSDEGSKQLATDISCIADVITSFFEMEDPLLQRVQEALLMEKNELENEISAPRLSDSTRVAVQRLIARKRGIEVLTE